MMANRQTFKVPVVGENVCLSGVTYGARVISECFSRDDIISGNTSVYDKISGFTYHHIDKDPKGIVIQLGDYTYLNHLKMLLWDKDGRTYSYQIDVAADIFGMNQTQWDVIWNHTTYQCHSWQEIWFRPRVIRYIRILGRWSSANEYLCVVALQAYLDIPKSLEYPISRKWKLIIPSRNVASEECGARLVEGIVCGGASLIAPRICQYAKLGSYTEHTPGGGAIIIRLAQPYVVSSMRLKLHCSQENNYRYVVDTSHLGGVWCRVRKEKIGNKSNDWEIIKFEPKPVSFIRFCGSYSGFGSSNPNFESESSLQVSYLECPAPAQSNDSK